LDITKCINTQCPLKENCYRWTAKADEYSQSYASFAPKEWKCDYFISNAKKGEKDD